MFVMALFREKTIVVRENSRQLADAEKSGTTSDEWEPKNGKVNPLWRPGGGWKPGTFLDPQGPKVVPAIAQTCTKRSTCSEFCVRSVPTT